MSGFRVPPRATPSHSPSAARTDPDAIGFAAKIRVRYLVEKFIEGQWVSMARFPDGADRMLELCQAIGGTLRVQDLNTLNYVIDQEFE